MIKMNYKDSSAFDFQSAIQKLATATTDGVSAYRIKKVYAAVKAHRLAVAEEYKKDVMGKFAKKDEKGEWAPETFCCIEGQEEAYAKAQDEFGERTWTLPRPKLTLHDIRDAKLTAMEQLALDPVLDDSEGEAPAKPSNVVKLG
jgi:hypothetical protein